MMNAKAARRAGRTTIALLSSTVSMFALPALAPTSAAQEAGTSVDDIVVTGARRAYSVQDVPVNITAVGAGQIEQQGFDDLAELATFIPGLHILDQGHGSNQIIVRGLNADSLAQTDSSTDGGGTVGVYVGDIPLVVNLNLKDVERVEVLMGPQGTLYGSGTIGGAIRYVPRLPQFEESTISYRADGYGYAHGDDPSYSIGTTFNIPIGRHLALRGSIDRGEDSGFIDYPYIVQTPGLSEPDIDFSDPAQVAANLSPVEDANDNDLLSGRIALRWQPVTWYDSTLTYYFQNTEASGRQVSSIRSQVNNGDKWATNRRVPEQFQREIDLLALEQNFELGFAELTSSTGYSRINVTNQRDQTDLLLLLDPANSYYYYDDMPTFTGFTRDNSRESRFTTELRLTSLDTGSPLTWLVGVFYGNLHAEDDGREYTPGYSNFAFNNLYYEGPAPRTDAIEYYKLGFTDQIEQGLFGEFGYDLTEKWNVTVGARYYTYNLKTLEDTIFPILSTQLITNPDYLQLAPDEIRFELEGASQRHEGTIWKFNTSYDFTEDVMGYFTYSEGYRIGNSNGEAPCTGSGTQNVCALPNELSYESDSTQNYEIGFRTEWFDSALTVNFAAYFIDWLGPQVSSATQTGLSPITINASDATSRGFEVNFNARATERWTIRGSYSYNDTQLNADAPLLITVLNSENGFVVPNGPSVADGTCASGQLYDDPASPFNGQCLGDPFAVYYLSGQKGDRLPGTAQHQASLFTSYALPLDSGLELRFDYGAFGISDVLTRTGGRGNSLVLGSYIIQNAAIALEGEKWGTTFYVNNIFDEFAETGVSGTRDHNTVLTSPPYPGASGTIPIRSFYTNVLPPRTIGVRMSYQF